LRPEKRQAQLVQVGSELPVIRVIRISQRIIIGSHRRVDAQDAVAEGIADDDVVVLRRLFNRRPAHGMDIGDDVVAVTAAEKVVGGIARIVRVFRRA